MKSWFLYFFTHFTPEKKTGSHDFPSQNVSVENCYFYRRTMHTLPKVSQNNRKMGTNSWKSLTCYPTFYSINLFWSNSKILHTFFYSFSSFQSKSILQFSTKYIIYLLKSLKFDWKTTQILGLKIMNVGNWSCLHSSVYIVYFVKFLILILILNTLYT